MKCKDFYMTQPLSYHLLILFLLPRIAQRPAACSFERMAEQVLARDGYFIVSARNKTISGPFEKIE